MSRKVYVPPNSEIRIECTRGTLKIGWRPEVRNSLHVNNRNVHVPPMRPHVSENARSTEQIRKYKQPKTHVPPQRFSVKQRYKNSAIPPKNNVTPLQQRWTTAVR